MSVCFRCGTTIDVTRKGEFYRRIQGWEAQRSKGGANQIVLREVIPEMFACRACILKMKHKISADQETLL